MKCVKTCFRLAPRLTKKTEKPHRRLLVLCECKNDSDRISWIKSEHSQHTPSSSESMSGLENFFKFPSLSKLFWLFQSNTKSYCACGQNHLRWSCLSISFNFLSEFGFNWTIDHNEDFNRQSKDWARRAGDWLLQLWLRSRLWLLTWVGCGTSKKHQHELLSIW